MEKVNYIIDDATIIELLGLQSFTSKESAILELVKNAFDAGAPTLTISIKKDEIIISDTGKGMSEKDFKDYWLHVGKSNKDYDFRDEEGNLRIAAGQRGIGRFALARLGSYVLMNSKTVNEPGITWETDWNKNDLEINRELNKKGTEFRISSLRDKWNDKEVRLLYDFLSRAYNDKKMQITLYFYEKKYEVKQYFTEPKIGINYASSTFFKYDSESHRLHITVENDEFLDEATAYCKDIDISKFSKEISIYDEFWGKDFKNDEIEEYKDFLTGIGNFSGDLYFGISRYQSEDMSKFLYKRTSLSDSYNSGIILYRNSFSISSFEGNKDWLELGKRSRKSPAAATHPTGAWRVRENQISGKILIDKKQNPNIQDLANRQGLNENLTYKYFKEIIHIVLVNFEDYRQSIIRAIDKKNKPSVSYDEKSILDDILSGKVDMSQLSDDEQYVIKEEVKKQKEDFKKKEDEYKQKEENYIYDVRILNVLATSGLRATAKAHELKNDRNNIVTNYDNIVNALNYYDFWDELLTPEKTSHSYRNVPSLLEKNKDVSIKVVQFMDTMLTDIERKQFLPEVFIIRDVVEDIRDKWKREYSWANFEINVDDNLSFYTSKDVIEVILDNLILNSLQQNEKNNSLIIKITITKELNCLFFNYADNGCGLHAKYKNNPMRILKPHETTREKGHGLGMWIINNTLNMTGGKIISIQGNSGFGIDFTIGDKIKYGRD